MTINKINYNKIYIYIGLYILCVLKCCVFSLKLLPVCIEKHLNKVQKNQRKKWFPSVIIQRATTHEYENILRQLDVGIYCCVLRFSLT